MARTPSNSPGDGGRAAATTATPQDAPAAPAPAARKSPAERARADVARARAALTRNALRTPDQDNAVRWARSALSAEPGNAEAIAVLREVMDRYLVWSNRSLEADRLAEASRFLDDARHVSEHATRDQLAAADVLQDRIATRQRRLAGSRPRYQMEGPKWLRDLDTWVRGLPLPRDER